MKVQKTTEQKTQDFFKTVEAGDISLFQPFNESIAIFGFTKVGKTSSCHILANSPLRSEMIDGSLGYKPATQKYSTAIVGIGSQSETEIPNIFDAKFKDKNGTLKTVYLLDQPGYGDTYGFHRIFSNGYFHYRTFSKTPKLKFILAFKKNDLQGTGDRFKSTIELFINSFQGYDSIAGQILKATSFLITQCDPKSNIENIKKSIMKLRDSPGAVTEEQKQKYQTMLNNMLSENKVYIIERPEAAGNQTKECDILRQIYEKTTFWERQTKNSIADMSRINFSVAAEIITPLFSYKGNALFKKQFDHFMGFMQTRINQILINHEYSLLNIVKMLIRDATQDMQAHSFLAGMQEFNKTYYQFYDAYREKRVKTEASLFNLADLNQSAEYAKSGLLNNELVKQDQAQREKEMRQVYFIKKFKVLQFIKTKTDQIMLGEDLKRSVEELQSISSFFIEMFRRFNYLRVQKGDSEKIIYKYSYVIQRLIEESKIITLILFSNEKARSKFDEYKEGMVDIFRPLKDKLFAQFGDIDIPNLKQQFIDRLNFQKFQIVNKDIISFFEGVKFLDENVQLKIADLVLKYSLVLSEKRKNVKNEEKNFVAYKLFQYRNKYYDFYQNLNFAKSRKLDTENAIQKIFVLTNALASLLSSLNLYRDAREVYKSINNVEFVFRIFDTELKNSDDPEKIRSLLLEYGKYAGECNRGELAMKCFQEAYAKSTRYGQFKQVSAEIINLTKKSKEAVDPYLQKFYNEQFCSQFPTSLVKTLELLVQDQKLHL